jgi:hypothetical protein
MEVVMHNTRGDMLRALQADTDDTRRQGPARYHLVRCTCTDKWNPACGDHLATDPGASRAAYRNGERPGMRNALLLAVGWACEARYAEWKRRLLAYERERPTCPTAWEVIRRERARGGPTGAVEIMERAVQLVDEKPWGWANFVHAASRVLNEDELMLFV